ncbi:MAG: DJ-1/PfpI family protein [Patescibacteria group bacterium]|nr:DJ-1/PfpI family protein [Patescibacteria group bacterium]
MIILNPKARIIAFLGIFIIVLLIGLWAFQTLKSIEMLGQTLFLIMPNLEGKKIVFIVAFRDFRDEEYFRPKEILERAGAEIKTASTKIGQAIGADGGEVKVDLTLEDLKVSDFEAVVFIGGPGAIKYLDNEKSYRIAKETVKINKVLAAICISPTILAKAGVLKGKKATVWSSPLDKSPVKILKENGAIYQDELVVVDGKIITGNGPAAAEKFGMKIVEALTEK